jgi:exopolysaccharide biosynthesis polyprenyl glycosylphosphotransferase
MVERSSTTYLLLFGLDSSLTLLALHLAKILREIIPVGVFLDEPLQFNGWLYLIVPFIWVIVFAALKVYSPHHSLENREDLSLVWGAIVGAALIFAGVAYLLFRELSRFLFLYFFILDLLLLSGWRWLLPHSPVLSRYLYGLQQRRVLIVGIEQMAQALVKTIKQRPETQLNVVGFAADKTQSVTCAGYPILGTIADVPYLAEKHQVHEVIFALPPNKQYQLRFLVIALAHLPLNIRLVPDVFDLIFLRSSVEEFGSTPLIGLREPAIQGIDRLLKRLFDVAVTLFLLIFLSPLMGLIALLIKLDSPGPILFQQKRVGEGGRHFWMYKFRSMIDGAEQLEAQLLQKTSEGLPLLHKSPLDSRITRVGYYLRRTSLDELPQLFNVLKGEMSLVGPRPEIPGVVEQYEHWQRKRFALPQGMTGWWQINGRMERSDPQQRAEDDLFYIKNHSFWLDLRILWKTLQVIILGRGAY